MLNVFLSLFRRFNILTSGHKSDIMRIFYVLVAILLIFAFLFSHYEKISFFKAFYWAVTTASTVGYGDVVPHNTIGRVIAILLMFFGIGILSIFLVTFSSIIFDVKIKRLLGTMENYFIKGHIVILGYSDIINASLDNILKEGHNVILLAPLEKTPSEEKNFIFIKGNIVDDKDILKTKIQQASLCIISDNDDSKTLMSAIATRTLDRDLYIIAYVHKKEASRALKETGINEVFTMGNFSKNLLVKSIKIKGVANFFTQLMEEDSKSGLIEKDVSDNLVGKKFYESLSFLKQTADEIIVGVKRNDKTIINPDGESFILEKGDKLLLIGKA
ncbi:MAG: ion channel [Candidatus Omnitrophica bacterium]|jgi:voltage-gated potassium channel|nr:ion channel [Candidatus Omnitrophota bacterium]